MNGIVYDPSPKTKSVIYQEFLPALNGQRVRMLDHPRLVGQLVGLERRTARGGRDSIDHGPGGRDDVANSAAGVLVNLIADRRPALVRQSDMLTREGVPLAMPKRCQYLAAVFWPGKDGTCACVFGAFAAPNVKPAMTIVDFDCAPMRPAEFAFVLAKVHQLLGQCGAPSCVVFVPANLKRHAEAAGLPCEQIPEDFEPEERIFSVSQHVGAGSVKLAAPVVEKARNSPFAGALDLRAAEGADNPLRAAAILLIALGLDEHHLAPRAVR